MFPRSSQRGDMAPNACRISIYSVSHLLYNGYSDGGRGRDVYGCGEHFLPFCYDSRERELVLCFSGKNKNTFVV